MILEHLNYAAVAVSALVYFLVGSVWFSPIGFSKAWVTGHGIVMDRSEEGMARMKKQMPKLFGMTFVFCFIATIALACLQGVIGTNNCMAGAKLGLTAGVFVWVAFAQSHMYTRKPFSLAIIDAGYHIVGLVAAGIILSAWH